MRDIVSSYDIPCLLQCCQSCSYTGFYIRNRIIPTSLTGNFKSRATYSISFFGKILDSLPYLLYFAYTKFGLIEKNKMLVQVIIAIKDIATGFKDGDMKKVKLKSQMKPFYAEAGIKAARYCLADSPRACKKFIDEVGYPVIVKPDNGVGANDTHRLCSDDDLIQFFATKLPVRYIMEEYIDATVNSYDAIVNSKGEPIFETGNVTLGSLMDVVNTGDSSMFYIVNQPFEDVREAGRRTLRAFGVRSRFVHFEFFRLNRDQHIGKKGEIVALEVNMRPSGGISPEMMNYANSTDVYKIWADMVAFDCSSKGTGERFYCAFVGRRDGKPYVHSDDEIYSRYAGSIKIARRVAKALSGAMGDRMFVVNVKTKEEVDEFYRFTTECRQ